jgi:hypothetical protein
MTSNCKKCGHECHCKGSCGNECKCKDCKCLKKDEVIVEFEPDFSLTEH